MRRMAAATTLFILMYCIYSFGALKREYGGNLKVAEELLGTISSQTLFRDDEGTPRPRFRFPFTRDGSDLTFDLSAFDPDLFTEMEKHIAEVQKPDDSCHWILDYPYLSHNHTTVIEARDGTIRIHTESPEILAAIAESSCLVPQSAAILSPFLKTQFGYEANSTCLAGRPFLDSITPAPVDSSNPYLSFKLNDADVISIPEDRFQQISRDEDIRVMPGPKYLVFLSTEGLSQDAAAAIASTIRVWDLGRAVLNGHIEPLLNAGPATGARPGTRVHFVYPQDPPYRLVGERIELDLREAGFDVNPPPGDVGKTGNLNLEAFPLPPGDDDIARYLLLKKYYPAESRNLPWFEIWDEYEAEGKILPLFTHTTMLAVRKGVQDFASGPDGIPNFSGAWIEPHP